MTNSPTSRLATNLVAQVADILARSAQQIFIVPLLIAGWGIDTYGHWLEYSSAAGLLAMLPLGSSQYLAAVSHQAFSRGAHEDGIRSVRVSAFVTAALSAIGFGFCIAIAPWEPRPMVLLCASAVLSLWLGLLAGVYRAADLYSRGIVVGNCVILAQVFLIVIVVRSGGTPSMAALTQLFAVSGGLVAMLADLRRTRPLLHFFPLIPNKVELRDLCRVSPSYFLITAGSTLFVNGPIVILTCCSIPAPQIVIFNLARTLSNLIRQVWGQMGLSFGTELARFYAKHDRVRFDRLFVAATRFLTFVCGACSGVVLAFGSELVALWTGGRVPGDVPVIAVLVAPFFVSMPGHLCSITLAFIGRPKLVSYAYVAQSAILMLCGALAAPLYGILGMSAAIAVSEFVSIGIFLLIFGGRMLAIPGESAVLVALASGIGVLALSYFVGLAITSLAHGSSIALAALAVGVWCPLMLLIAWMWIVPESVRMRVKTRLLSFSLKY